MFLYIKNNYKWISLSVLVLFLISGIYALQTKDECNVLFFKGIYFFTADVFKNGLLKFMKYFSWSFLVFMLFLIPSCYKKVEKLISLASDGLERYGKSFNKNEVNQQNTEDKKKVEKEKEDEIKISIQEDSNRADKKNKQFDLAERIKFRENFELKVIENLELLNICDLQKDIKLPIIGDPISDTDFLNFDLSYRYKGNDRARRYIYTLFTLSNIPSRMFFDKVYCYLRMIKDKNDLRSNQRFAVEIVFLKMENFGDNSSYSYIEHEFRKALNAGVLAIKEYEKNQDGSVTCIKKAGWILDS